MGDVKGIRNKVLKSDSMVFEFLRSIVSSQAASWLDMLKSFGFFAWLGIYPWLATLCGAFAGGVTNCIINYKFTFHASGLPWKAVAVKYFLVWVGSVALNSLGTEFLYRLLRSLRWVHENIESPDAVFAAVRLAVSLVVSLAWNFILQRNFVYRTSRFDRSAIAIMNVLTIKSHTKHSDNEYKA